MEMLAPTSQVSFVYSSGHLAWGKHGKLAIRISSQLLDTMKYMEEESYVPGLARGMGGGLSFTRKTPEDPV